ncbi:hypothetical protein [Clostridium arbusti]|uniref:hypothetical protein n=1 Tax=Clostridium arbusti TaxID=1137848 RepID=UPI000289A1D0|nr:hypothetical protein [Clostridium arbusti]
MKSLRINLLNENTIINDKISAIAVGNIMNTMCFAGCKRISCLCCCMKKKMNIICRCICEMVNKNCKYVKYGATVLFMK